MQSSNFGRLERPELTLTPSRTQAITFEGKRYVGNKMNIAMDLIIERGKK